MKKRKGAHALLRKGKESAKGSNGNGNNNTTTTTGK
jgi:hypothetical protein